MFGQEQGLQGSGVDLVEACFSIEDKSGDPESRPLKGSDLMTEGEAAVVRTETWEGVTLVGVGQSIGVSDG